MSGGGLLIGREPVLAAAGLLMAEARRGAGQFLLINGEAGIGKTALLTALARSSASAGALVLSGFCWQGEGAPPYWPWSQVLRTSGLPAAELGAAAWLTQPTTTTAELRTAAEAAHAQFLLFEAVSASLAGLAADRPLVVVLDDLHWADAPSLRLLGFLARSLAGDAVALLGAYRDAEAPGELHELAASAQQLALPGLDSAQVGELARSLAGAHVPPEVCARLWERSGGNPFFVRELTRLLLAQGSELDQTAVPAGVAETLRRRLARLSTDCMSLLGWAAVAGRDIDPGLLAFAGAVADETVARTLLDEAREAGVVSEAPSGPQFAHDLYREVVVQGLSSAAGADINLAIGCALRSRPGPAARIAAHLAAAGGQARQEALEYSLRAAREATARLGHQEACAHYLRALKLADLTGNADCTEILLELGVSYARVGDAGLARQQLLAAAEASQSAGDAVGLARSALSMQMLGNRSGAQNSELLGLLRQASQQLSAADGPLALQSRVQAALARVIRHGSESLPGPEVRQVARRAVELAAAANDAHALATAKLAMQDVLWVPGSAAERLPVIAEMLDAAQAAGDGDLVAEAHLLRAAALLELGDPAGRDEMQAYIALAMRLGHARGRWGALTRRATYAQLAGRVEEAARLGEQGLELGLAIGEPDAIGCYSTHRWAMVALGVAEPGSELESNPDDPLWPIFPLFRAWAPAARGQAAAAAAALGDFSVLNITPWTGLEALAVAAVVFAVAGSDAQRRWAYERLLPHAGTHVVVGGCASYHAAVDYHLGGLAVALGDISAGEAHFRAALAMHERLGAAGWARLSAQALVDLESCSGPPEANEFRLSGGVRLISYNKKPAQLPESKGLHDIAVLMGAGGTDVHVLTLTGRGQTRLGADPVLDNRAKAEFRARLDDLEEKIDDAAAVGRSDRAEALRAERAALVRELATAAGLGGRDRRLGDETERARKTVSARVRDAVAKLDRVHPELAAHLRDALQMGTVCCYRPDEPTSWHT
jgi:AAA ATPase domain